jgi:hypothetical protein
MTTAGGKNRDDYVVAYNAADGCVTHRNTKTINDDLPLFSSNILLGDDDDHHGNTALSVHPIVHCRRGCLVLGTNNVESVSQAINNADSDGVYLTNYGIDHERQSHGLCSEVFLDECSPCCRPCRHERSSNALTNVAIGVLASAIRSEIFLYSLHMLAIVLGAVKEGIGTLSIC